MRSRIWGIVTMAMWVLTGCNSSMTAAPGDAATDSSATGTPGMCSAGVPTGQACNALSLAGTGVMPTCPTGPPPAGQGGTVVDGIYVLTSLTYYNATSCPTISLTETIEIASDCIQVKVGAPLANTGSTTFTIAGSSITLTRTCTHLEVDGATVSTANMTQTFTAGGTTFTLITQHDIGGTTRTDVAVFTKQ